MTSGQNAGRPFLAKRRGPKPAISDQALLVSIEADLETSPWEGEWLPQGLGSASGLSRHQGCPQAGAPPDAREQPALAPSLPPPWRQWPMTVRSSLMPRTSCGAPTAFGAVHGGRRLGLDLHRPSSIGTPSRVGWHVCKRGDRFAALQPISMGLASAVWLDLGRLADS